MVTQIIQSEILLELAYRSTLESNEELILKNAIPHYLRKLNCTMAAVLKKNGNELEESFFIPFVMRKSEDWQKVKKHCYGLTPNDKDPCNHFVLNENQYYIFCLKSYGLFILGRKLLFDNSLLHELKPIINHLGKNLSIATEIAKRIQAESLLKEREKSLRTVLQSTAANILIYQKKSIIYVNPAAEKLTGYTNNELCQLNIYDLVHPDFVSFLKENNPTLKDFSYIKNPHFEIEILKKNGRTRWIDVRAGLIEWKGEKAGILSAFDITKRKKVELQLIKAKEEAEKSERLKSAFLANMSHEIRTPMNGILGFSGLLKNPNINKDKQQKYIEIIEKSGHRLLNLINNIIDISKIEADLMKIKYSDISINEQFDYLFLFFNAEAKAKGIELVCKKRLSDPNDIISTDLEKLYAILLNLIKNALKYTDSGSIEFGYCLKEFSTPLTIEFYVKDTGIGIPKNRQEAIFERFIQADIEDLHAKEGAGLGLSISKAYVHMLGGDIRLDSSVNKGTCFYFTIPYKSTNNIQSEFESIVEKNQAVKKSKQLKTLIVEDDDTSKLLTSMFLEPYSHTILEASNGAEAIEICKSHLDIDLILMDIKMPLLNGFEATEQIRKFNKKVIIIAQTAYSLVGDKEKILNVGCNDYISKPISKSAINTIIDKHFNHKTNGTSIL